MKSKYNTAKFRSQTLGSTLATILFVSFSSSAIAADNIWNGGSTNWNTITNWSLGGLPTAPDDAVINMTSPANFPVLTANPSATPRDNIIGRGVGNSGRLDVLSGNVVGSGWTYMGIDGGTGVLNIADTTTAGAGISGYAPGPGGVSITGRIWLGRNAGGSGTMNVNTSGTINTNNDRVTVGYLSGTGVLNWEAGTMNCNDLAVAWGNATGTMNMSGGTINTTGWNFVGKKDGAENGANGSLTMTGGTINNTGRTYVGHPTCTGLMVLDGGTYKNNNNEVFIIGGDSNENWFGGISTTANGTVTVKNSSSVLQSTGELWISNKSGTGTLDLSAGTVNVSNWLAVGRTAGIGIIEMTGGAINKTGGGNITIGTGTGGSGTINQSGGVITNTTSQTFIGEGWEWNGAGTGLGVGTWSLSGTGQAVLGAIIIGNGGASQGTFNLGTGGTLTTTKISDNSSGATNFNFNGGTLKAGSNETAFMAGLSAATVQSGGAVIDTNGFNIGISQALLDGTGGGGLTKLGTGTLTLTGANTYAGATTVNTGKLVLTTAPTGGGDVVVADAAILGVNQLANNQSLTAANATFGGPGGSTLDINLGNIGGNPTAAPLNVTGALTLNGPVTINIADTLPTIGTIPLVSYVDPKAGTGSFVLGTLPNGVVATFSDDGSGLVSLNVTSVSLPRWKGTVTGLVANGTWDVGTTQNWTDMVTTLPTAYTDPSPVLFPDNSNPVFTPNITLDTTVKPSKVTFTNSVDVYTLTGTGKISDSTSGPTALLKQGTAPLTVGTVNDFTGVVTLEGGTTTVNSLANGGSPSAIGASGSAASNLVLSGGTLSYTGPATTSDRGFTIAAVNSGISVANDVTLSGPVATFLGHLNKTGAGNLTLSYPGANVFGTNDPGLRVNEGTLTLSGGGTQTNVVAGELWVAATPGVSASLVLDDTSVTTGHWISVGRGNANGAVATLKATDSTIVSVNFSTGHNAGQATNDSDQFITLTNTSWTNNGQTILAENLDSYTKMVIGGTSSYVTSGTFRTALGLNTASEVIIQDNATMTKLGGYMSVGNSSNGSGIMTVKNSGSLTADGDLNVSDIDTSTGVFNIQDSATVTSTGTFYVAKNAGTTGTVNLDGGTLNAKLVRGGGGTGTFNFNGGLLQVAATGANPTFMSLVTNVKVMSGGARIDTNGNDVTIDQALLEDISSPGGGLIKSGAGKLTINSYCGYAGTTQVNAGTLAGNGTYVGPLAVAATATLSPGVGVGTINADSAALAGATLSVDIAPIPDSLVVNGALDISGTALVLTGTPTLPAYVIASYGTGQLTGTFSGVSPALPVGYSIDYNYNGNNEIAITRPVSAYETWSQTKIIDIDSGADATPAGDPDGDGSPNIVEFALNGDPLSGASSGKVVGKVANVSGSPTLVLTLPVRTGATFTAPAGEELVSALIDGVIYRIQGSDGLTTWNLAVSEVSEPDQGLIETGMPSLDPGWEYRTFRSPGNITGDPADFLRAVIQNP